MTFLPVLPVAIVALARADWAADPTASARISLAESDRVIPVFADEFGRTTQGADGESDGAK